VALLAQAQHGVHAARRLARPLALLAAPQRLAHLLAVLLHLRARARVSLRLADRAVRAAPPTEAQKAPGRHPRVSFDGARCQYLTLCLEQHQGHRTGIPEG